MKKKRQQQEQQKTHTYKKFQVLSCFCLHLPYVCMLCYLTVFTGIVLTLQLVCISIPCCFVLSVQRLILRFTVAYFLLLCFLVVNRDSVIIFYLRIIRVYYFRRMLGPPPWTY